MTAAGDDLGQRLRTQLAETARLLEQGDVDGATTAMDAAVALCRDCGSGLLPDSAIAEARALLRRCVNAEAELRRQMMDSLAQTAVSRRAIDAYRE